MKWAVAATLCGLWGSELSEFYQYFDSLMCLHRFLQNQLEKKVPFRKFAFSVCVISHALFLLFR